MKARGKERQKQTEEMELIKERWTNEKKEGQKAEVRDGGRETTMEGSRKKDGVRRRAE